MARFGFTSGGTYTSESPNVDDQRCVNLYPENVESQQGRTSFALYPRPGLKIDQLLAGESNIPELFTQNGRMFAAGIFLWERFSNGMWVNRGALNPAQGGPGQVFMTANQNQLLICSSGLLYVLILATNALIPVNMAQFNGPIVSVDFCDGFGLAFQANSGIFYTSNLLDFTTWQAVNAEQLSLITDFIVALIVSHRDVWLMGNKASIVYFNSGAALSPFIPISGAFVEQGIISAKARARADNSIFWVGQDERGALIAWRANAYTPQRISNHAVENAWAQYAVVSDLVTYACQFNGHIFWVLYFQAQQATWVYDVSTNMWHEWTFLDPSVGPLAHRSCCHCFAFNQHFVGDWETGTVYQMSNAFNDDFGHPIQKLRRAPTVSTENEWLQHHSMELDVESGLGPIPPLAGLAAPTTFILASPGGLLWQIGVTDVGLLTAVQIPSPSVVTPVKMFLNDWETNTTTWQVVVTDTGILQTTSVPFVATGQNTFPMVSAGGAHIWNLQVTTVGLLQTQAAGLVSRAPQVYLRWSDDSGHTWSSTYARDFGRGGNFKERVIWRRLGRSRQRVYEISSTDPVPLRIVDAYLYASPNYSPTERLTHQYRKEA
jgi:hypothetical protein